MSSKRKSVSVKAIQKYIDKDPIRLDLTERKIGDFGLEILAQNLAERGKGKPHTVEILDLFGNDLTDDAIPTLIQLLTKNYKIHTVKLEYNRFTAKGAKAISDFLRINTTLTKLDLYGNKIHDAGCEEIARALSHNTTLTNLGLFGCGITDRGATTLVRHLERNTSIRAINIEGNDIDDDLVDAVNAYLERNNGESDYEIPEAVAKFLKDFPEGAAFVAEEEEQQAPIVAAAPAVPSHVPSFVTTAVKTAPESSEKHVVPITTQIAKVPTDGSIEITGQGLAPLFRPVVPAVSDLKFQVEDYAKATNEKEWKQERQELIDKMRTLMQDKETLAKTVSRLNQQVAQMQRQYAHLENFVFAIKRNFSHLEREYPVPDL